MRAGQIYTTWCDECPYQGGCLNCQKRQIGEIVNPHVVPHAREPLRIAPMMPQAIEKVRQLEGEMLKHPQPKIAMQHTLHGGVYTRTYFQSMGILLTGSLLKVPTTMIVQGTAEIFIGESAPLLVEGYNVLACSAGRKVAVLAHSDVFMSTYFRTDAKTREEAEREATDDWAQLAPGLAVENITGE